MNTSNNNFNKVSISLAIILLKIMVVTAFACLITISGCQPGEGAVETDRVKKLLTSSAWTLESLTIDGADQTALYEGLTVTFNDTHFTSTNGGPAWPASGIWTFSNENGDAIVRGDGIELNIYEINETRLVMDITWTMTTLGPGKSSSTSGEHRFTFGK
jgi:hypothetical protein